ncbi:hypothetical protein HGA91_01400 [candidate division WWE3 bacterium]|nr:hypothetical protein [candidate division WWE3 bacterium]
MSKRSEFIKKIKEKTVGELTQQSEEMRHDIEKKDITRHFGENQYNVHELKSLKRDRARVLTLLNQKQESNSSVGKESK